MRYIKTYEKFTPLGMDFSFWGKKKFWKSIFKDNMILLTNAILNFAKDAFKEYDIRIVSNKNTKLIIFEQTSWIEFCRFRTTNTTEIRFIIKDENYSYTKGYIKNGTFRDSDETSTITGLELNEYLKFVIQKYSYIKNGTYYEIENEDIPELIKELNIEDYELFNNAKKYNL